MREDDDRPKAMAPPMTLADLQNLSIEDLTARISALRSDIAACETLIEAKRAQRGLADQLFSKGAD